MTLDTRSLKQNTFLRKMKDIFSCGSNTNAKRATLVKDSAGNRVGRPRRKSSESCDTGDPLVGPFPKGVDDTPRLCPGRTCQEVIPDEAPSGGRGEWMESVEAVGMETMRVGGLRGVKRRGHSGVEGWVGYGSVASIGGGTRVGIGSAGLIGGGRAGVRSRCEAVTSQVEGVPLGGGGLGEAPRRSNSRFARGPVVTRATDAAPVGTDGRGRTGRSVLARANRDELADEAPLAVRSEAEVFLFRLANGVDTHVCECEVERLEDAAARKERSSSRCDLREARERQQQR